MKEWLIWHRRMMGGGGWSWGPDDSGFEHYEHWHELPGFPTQREFDAMKHDRAAMERLGEDLSLSLLDPDGYWHPEPWWREDSGRTEGA